MLPVAFDPRKDGLNQAKHGVSLAEAARLEWGSAVIWTDLRWAYGEVRQCAIGYIGLRLHCVVFVERTDERRVISLRKANKREIRFYAEA